MPVNFHQRCIHLFISFFFFVCVCLLLILIAPQDSEAQLLNASNYNWAERETERQSLSSLWQRGGGRGRQQAQVVKVFLAAVDYVFHCYCNLAECLSNRQLGHSSLHFVNAILQNTWCSVTSTCNSSSSFLRPQLLSSVKLSSVDLQ